MTENYSDYEKIFFDIYNLLPAHLKKDVNRSFFRNTVNRMLTKSEVTNIVGEIGPQADELKIVETDPHREAFQLQPLLYKKIATVEHIRAFRDILSEMERLGVDISTYQKWGNSLKFNYAPPIDVNKLVNYRDYFWNDILNPDSKPQYITIKNSGTTEWSSQNNWVYKTEPHDPSKRATMPIIEFNPNLELNGWTLTNFVWKYRANLLVDWVDSATEPTLLEMTGSPLTTSHGDPWISFIDQWALVEQRDTLPTSNEVKDGGISVETWPGVVAQTSFPLVDVNKALLGFDDVRVYLDNIRQYGNYIEKDNDSNDFVDEIEFLVPVTGNVVIEIGYSVLADAGREAIDVRVNLDTMAVVEKRSLIRYRPQEQVKVDDNQYPLFNIYNLNGTHAGKASEIFMFAESSDQPIDLRIGKRIVVENSGTNFVFNQTLIDVDNGEMFGYIDSDTISLENPQGLQVIWKKGLNGEEYVPQWVDKDRTPITIGDETGFWEIPDTLFYNVNHENRLQIKFSDLFPHFNSILNEQVSMPDFTTNYVLNYGLGGKIREYNDGFDNFLSSVFVNNITPVSLFNFARQQYSILRTAIQQLFIRYFVDQVQMNTAEYILDLPGEIINFIVADFEDNDYYERLYGDSGTYDENSNIGMKNWIATLPYLKLLFSIEPYVLDDPKLNLKKVVSHDAHLAEFSLSDNDLSELIIAIILESAGTSSTVDPVLPGVQGDFWLNNITQTLFKYNNSVWEEVDINQIYFDLMLSIEKKLYDNTPVIYDTRFDFSILINDLQDQILYDEYLEDAFNEYVRDNSILMPYASIYEASDAFSWNYNDVDVNNVSYPNLTTSVPKPWGARWYVINEVIFGTAYPHLEPWKLQGYLEKPTWWNGIYLWTIDTTRRWQPLMWANLELGIVPVGELLSDGVTLSTGAPGESETYDRFSVNITSNTTTDGYAPDDLLPPYWVPPTGLINDTDVMDQALIQNGSYVLPTALDADYTFGDQGPVEREWRDSIRFNYDLFKVAYRMQPIKFVRKTFGNDFFTINGLEIDNLQNKVINHTDTVFHGETVNDQIFFSTGINQWYVDFIRYGSYDVENSDFKILWTEWDAKIGYQINYLIDTRSFDIEHANFFIIENDFSLVMKKTLGASDHWADSLKLTISGIGTHTYKSGFKIPIGDASDWTFVLDIPSPESRRVSYYDVESLQITVDDVTDIFTSVNDLPWDTGDVITFETTNFLPTPLESGVEYFVEKLSSNTFQVSETNDGPVLDITDTGIGVHFAERNLSTFYAFSAREVTSIWNHLRINKNSVSTTLFPLTITGLQNVINFIDGYSEYMRDSGFIFNHTDLLESDPDTGLIINWQLELERMIEAVYSGMGTINYNINPNSSFTALEYHEINPFKNNIWFNNEVGIVANIFKSPFKDINVLNGVYDQYGRKIDLDLVTFLRQDKLAHIRIDDSITNDIDVQHVVDPYKYIHIGGVRVFINNYEHVILLNDYTTENILIYDSYKGLITDKLLVEYKRQTNITNRPNIGGLFLSEGGFKSNIENDVGEIRNYYDTFDSDEFALTTQYARNLLGYEPIPALEQLNVTPKSQFLFWRGLIQQKGSVNSIKAFINAQSFEDAEIDEFWAYKIAEYGNAIGRLFPELKIFGNDVANNVLKLHFSSTYSPAQTGFIDVTLDNKIRWVNQPYVKRDFDRELNLNFKADVTEIHPHRVIIDSTQPTLGSHPDLNVMDFWIDSGSDELYEVVSLSPLTWELWITNHNEEPPFRRIAGEVFYKYGICDGINIVFDNGEISETQTGITSTMITSFSYIPNADNIDIFVDNVLLDKTLYTETNSTTIDFSHVLSVLNSVTVVRKGGFLQEGIHYERINNRIIKFLFDITEAKHFQVFYLNPSKDVYNPVKLLDSQAETIQYNVPIWHPAIGYNYHIAMHLIDYVGMVDPAVYSFKSDGTQDETKPWGSEQVGRVWFDTRKLAFKPYNDPIIIPDVDKRIGIWGEKAEWAELQVKEWVESSMPPAEWEQTVSSNDANTSGFSGTPEKHLFSKERENHNFSIVKEELASAEIQLNSNPYYGTITLTDVTGLDFSIYVVKVLVDATEVIISIDGSKAQTFGDLLVLLNDDLNAYDVEATLEEDKIVLRAQNKFIPSVSIDDEFLTTTIGNVGVVDARDNVYTSIPNAAINSFDGVDVYAGMNVLFSSLENFEIVGSSASGNTITINGNFVSDFPNGKIFRIIDSTLNDGLYVVSSSSLSTTKTIITIDILAVSPYTNNITTNNGGGKIINTGISLPKIYTASGTPSNWLWAPQTPQAQVGDFVLVNDGSLFAGQRTGLFDGGWSRSEGLFHSLINFDSLLTPTTVVLSEFTTVTSNLFANYEEVYVFSSETLPAPLQEATIYYVGKVGVGPYQYYLASSYDDVAAGNWIGISDLGFGTHTIMKRQFPDDWTVIDDVHFDYDVVFVPTSPIFPVPGEVDYKKVEVFINGKFIDSLDVISETVDLTSYNLNLWDNVHIVSRKTEPTDEQLSFDPDTADDGLTTEMYLYEYDYASKTFIDVDGESVSFKYYFWVQNSILRTHGKNLSITEISQQLERIPTPFSIFQNMLPTTLHQLIDDSHVLLPNRYSQYISKGLLGIVDDDVRYKLRFTIDPTLRDSLNNLNVDTFNVKDYHSEWTLFREKQIDNIPRALWNKITESMIGYSLSDNNIFIPDPEKTLYDSIYGTETQYGLKDGQAFVKSVLALNTIQEVIKNQDFDIDPINKDMFVNTYTFDTNENIITAMDFIYNFFPAARVNELFFEVLNDALTTKQKFEQLFKTSYISLKGTIKI